jgi:hypothetical protein
MSQQARYSGRTAARTWLRAQTLRAVEAWAAAPMGRPATGNGRVIEFTPSDGDIEQAEAFRTAWLSALPRLARQQRVIPAI